MTTKQIDKTNLVKANGIAVLKNWEKFSEITDKATQELANLSSVSLCEGEAWDSNVSTSHWELLTF